MNEPWNRLGFGPADILLPQGVELEKWSVVACDQYTSQPEYWNRVEERVGESPSALRMILPEQQLNDGRTEEHITASNAAMEDYLSRGLFRTLPESLIYVERRLSAGAVRRGIVGQVDLEAYDYRPGASSLIRATERTVLSRIPPRMAVRRHAALELPHVMLLMDDPNCEVIEHYSTETDRMERLYDFPLMEQGGRVTGWLLDAGQTARLAGRLSALADPEKRCARYGLEAQSPLLFAVGDGNHSLAAAKAIYEEKKGTPEGEKARYALVELVNLHDASLVFHPIHRVCFGVEAEPLLTALLAAYPGAHTGEGQGQRFRLIWQGHCVTVTVPESPESLAVGTVQTFLDAYLPGVGGTVDYVHGEEVARRLGGQPGNLAFLLPPMGKDQLFPAVIRDGVLPRKTFSMGAAQDKRFYLEARRIR